MEPVEVHFLVTREDFIQVRQAYCRAELSKSEVRLTRLLGGLLAAAGAAGMCFLSWGVVARIGFALMIVGGGVFLLYYDTLYPYLLQRQTAALLKTARLTARTVRLDEQGVQLKADGYQAKLPYAMLWRVVESKAVFLLYLGEGERHFLPKRALSEEEQQRLQKHLKRVMKENYMQEGVR